MFSVLPPPNPPVFVKTETATSRRVSPLKCRALPTDRLVYGVIKSAKPKNLLTLMPFWDFLGAIPPARIEAQLSPPSFNFAMPASPSFLFSFDDEPRGLCLYNEYSH